MTHIVHAVISFVIEGDRELDAQEKAALIETFISTGQKKISIDLRTFTLSARLNSLVDQHDMQTKG